MLDSMPSAQWRKIVVKDEKTMTEIEEFSAAEKAGLKIGDVIIEVNGTKITTMDELNEIKNKHKIGDKLKLKVYRNGTQKEFTVTLQEQ